MIANFTLVNELFRGFYIQRWNDRIRPMDLIEMDKHAHKMIIAWCLGKYEEKRGNRIDWDLLIKSGIYELLRRIVISDIKSPIFAHISRNKEVFNKLNNYIFRELEAKIESDMIKDELNEYLFNTEPDSNLTMRILNAAHIYASYWEFQIIKISNPDSYQNIRIETELLNKIDKYNDLDGISKLKMKHTISNFIDLFGQLRFHIRWAQTPRIPRTSVLGHILLVACLAYFFSRENNSCPKRLYNNFFGGLFHDLPEAVTRDIISPIKRSSEEFELLLKDIEMELAEQEIYPLIEQDWINEIKYYIEDEFANKVIVEKNLLKEQITVDIINKNYNDDAFNPYDGEIIRTADQLAAFLEAYNSIMSGVRTEELSKAARKIKDQYQDKTIGKVQINLLYQSFTF